MAIARGIEDRRIRSRLISDEYGHVILFTPPYHPELQPIEQVWAAIKNPIAFDPARDMQELHAKIWEGIDKVDSKRWLQAYRRVQDVELAYLEQVADEADVDSDNEELEFSEEDDN